MKKDDLYKDNNYGLDSIIKYEKIYNIQKIEDLNYYPKKDCGLSLDTLLTSSLLSTNSILSRRSQPARTSTPVVAPRPAPIPTSPPTAYQSGINWGTIRLMRTAVAYIEPTPEEVQRVLDAVHRIQELSPEEQKQLIEATREIRYFMDGDIRGRFGATRHFNAIRCLNDPTYTEVASLLSTPGTQLAGEEFFGLNRFMSNFPDIAEIQWWAVYKDGSWRLASGNPEGEHLDTDYRGWGDLVASVVKVNGRILSPTEMIALYRSIRLRSERGFMSDSARDGLATVLKVVDSGERLPRRYDEQIEVAQDLGLVDEHGRTLTYVGKSMITSATAIQRKERQLRETDSQVRRIIVPTLFN